MFAIGFWLFDISIDIVLTFEFCHDIAIWRMEISDKVDYNEIEPALGRTYPALHTCLDGAHDV